MIFEVDNHVSCVSFSPSNGLNESTLAVGVGRRIFLYSFSVEEFPVMRAEGDEQGPMSGGSDFADSAGAGGGTSTGRATSSAISVLDERPRTSGQSTRSAGAQPNTSTALPQSQPNLPRNLSNVTAGSHHQLQHQQQLRHSATGSRDTQHHLASPRGQGGHHHGAGAGGGHMGKNLIVGSAKSEAESESSPILPPMFLDGSLKDANNLLEEYGEQRFGTGTGAGGGDLDEPANGPVEELRGHFDEGFEETTDEEEEVDARDVHKVTVWNLKWVAVFREPSAVRSIHWNVNPDGFTAEFCDGKLRSYKCEFGGHLTQS